MKPKAGSGKISIKIVKVLTSSRKRGGRVTTYNLALEGQMEEVVEFRAIPGYGMRSSLKTLMASWCHRWHKL